MFNLNICKDPSRFFWNSESSQNSKEPARMGNNTNSRVV